MKTPITYREVKASERLPEQTKKNGWSELVTVLNRNRTHASRACVNEYSEWVPNINFKKEDIIYWLEPIPEITIEPYQQLVDAIKKMGWGIAVTTENADDEILRGLIIGEDSYVDDILEQIEGDE